MKRLPRGRSWTPPPSPIALAGVEGAGAGESGGRCAAWASPRALPRLVSSIQRLVLAGEKSESCLRQDHLGGCEERRRVSLERNRRVLHSHLEESEK